MPFAVLIGPETHNKVAGPRNQCAAGYFKSAATDFSLAINRPERRMARTTAPTRGVRPIERR